MSGRVPSRAAAFSGGVAVALALLAAPRPATAQAPAPPEGGWVGKRVITRPGAVLNDPRSGEVDDGDRAKNVALTGKSRSVFRTYMVEHVNGPWLWLREENGPAEGWVDVSRVVPFDRAIDFYTTQIRANPTAANYISRANVRVVKGEFDVAIADLNEAIRLDPSDGLSYVNRGVAWRGKRKYDQAVADFNEAIRLDPKYAPAHNNRGRAWRDKGEYGKAIADFDEAIRLDPKDAKVHYHRGNAWQCKREYGKAIADYAEATRLDPRLSWPYYGRAVVSLLTGRDGESEALAVIERDGWRGGLATYAALIGHFAARRIERGDAARRWLDDMARAWSKDAWPYPVVRFLRREIDEPALLALATDDDKRTEARCFLGLDHLLSGHLAAAREHLRWVKEHGNATFTEYMIAAAELDRLEAKGKP